MNAEEVLRRLNADGDEESSARLGFAAGLAGTGDGEEG